MLFRSDLKIERLVTDSVEQILQPSRGFEELLVFPGVEHVPSLFGLCGHVLLLSVVVGLWRRPVFAAPAAIAIVTLGTIFACIYPSSLRHEGLLLVFFMGLYWMEAESRNDR